MNTRAWVGLVAIGVLSAACSGSGSGGVPGTGTGPDGGGTTGGTTAPTVMLPAGLQYSGAPIALPAGTSEWMVEGNTWSLAGTVDDTAYSICPTGSEGCLQRPTNPVFLTGSLGGQFTTTQVDDIGTWPLPTGFGLALGFRPAGMAHSAKGFVMVGNVRVWDSRLYYSAGSRSVLWHSADGVSWQRIDVRDIVGDTNVDLFGVTAVGNGFIAYGEIAQHDLNAAPSRTLVLSSPDGVTWKVTGDLAGTWATEARGLVVAGDTLLLSGQEYACTPDASDMADFSIGAQARLWSSIDGGASWKAVDLAATGVADDVKVIPSDPAACPDFAGREAYRWAPSLLGFADGVFLVGSRDGSKVATSTDLTTWKVTDLPDGAPTPQTGTTISPPDARVVYADDGGIHVLSMEKRRDADGVQSSFGKQMRGWTSTDHGVTWVEDGLARPFADDVAGRPAVFGPGMVGRWLVTADPVTHVQSYAVQLSTAGRLVPWTTCVPAPAANCAFSTIDAKQSFAGKDLTGIDLTAAYLSGADLSGANLTNAVLKGAATTGTSFAHANLTGALLQGAYLSDAILTGADLTGADLTGASLPGSVLLDGVPKAKLDGAYFTLSTKENFEGLDLSGANLAGTYITGDYNSVVDMHRVNFAGANLVGTYFSRVDLTGATFAGATTTGTNGQSVYFDKSVICPDGAPPTPGQYSSYTCKI